MAASLSLMNSPEDILLFGVGGAGHGSVHHRESGEGRDPSFTELARDVAVGVSDAVDIRAIRDGLRVGSLASWR